MKAHEWRWAIRDAPLDRACKAVAWALDSRMNGDGVCWPSKAQLADDTGYSVRTVDRAVTRLERAGYVKVKRGNGRGHPNYYRPKQPRNHDGVYGKKPRHQEHINPVTSDALSSSKEVFAHAIQVDQAMLALAHGWLRTH